jgi:Tfp pilus assembly protein PilF
MADRIETLLIYLERDPSDTFARFALAMEYFKQGQFQLSEHEFKRLLAIDPFYLGAYYHLGKLYHQHDQLDRAQIIFHQGLEAAKTKKEEHQIKELKEAIRLVELDQE